MDVYTTFFHFICLSDYAALIYVIQKGEMWCEARLIDCTDGFSLHCLCKCSQSVVSIVEDYFSIGIDTFWTLSFDLLIWHEVCALLISNVKNCSICSTKKLDVCILNKLLSKHKWEKKPWRQEWNKMMHIGKGDGEELPCRKSLGKGGLCWPILGKHKDQDM